MDIRYSSILIIILILVSCKSKVIDNYSKQDEPQPSNQNILEDATKFAEEVLGDRLRVHFTEYKRGEIGVDAIFESGDLIGYNTFSNDKYQKLRSPVDIKDCILFAGEYKNIEGAESAFNFLKENSVIPPSDVEGMVGPTPVQVRVLERIRNDGDGGLFAQQGNYLFFLNKGTEKPPVAANWGDYENMFLKSIGGEESLETIRLR